MDLIFFDLDGTLLNKDSEISLFTRETLGLLRRNRIAHTVATGRTMLSARKVIGEHPFELPHIYSNGVAVWDPRDNGLTLENLLNDAEIQLILDCAFSNGIAPFVNTVATEGNLHKHIVFHGQTRNQIERDLIDKYYARSEVVLMPLERLPDVHNVTNISMIGATEVINQIYARIQEFPGLVAYSGASIQGDQFSWIDIHHQHANKGSAVENLKHQLGATNIICFGDSYNDMSMFEFADESYAPQNAKEEIKAIASAVIGDHHEDGIALFLRERFSL